MTLTLTRPCRQCGGDGYYREPDPAGRGQLERCEMCNPAPSPPPMTPAEFVTALATLGLSVRQYAEMTGISNNTMKNWATHRLATPAPHADWLRRNVAIRLADPAPKR